MEDEMIMVSAPDKGEVVEITRKKKEKEGMPPFNIVDNGFSNRHGASLDILEVCLQLNIAEQKLLQFFRDCFTKNVFMKDEMPNVIEPLKWQEFDKYLAAALMKNFVHMEYLGVLKRVKRGLYMINPDMLIPPKDYLVIKTRWEQIK